MGKRPHRASRPRLVAPPTMPTKPRVAIATPVYGQTVQLHFCGSVFSAVGALREVGAECDWISYSSPSARWGRNTLVAQFLAVPDFTHLMWVDADVSFGRDAIPRLLAHDLPVVAGLYPAKRLPLRFEWVPVRDEAGVLVRNANGLIRARLVDGGFVLVKREVYLRLVEAYPERRLVGDPGDPIRFLAPWMHDLHPEDYALGQLGPHEDYGFCNLWTRIGGEIWVDPTVQLTHHGMHGYQADPATLIQARDHMRQVANG